MTVPDEPARTSWVDVPENSPFPLHNLPFGVARRSNGVVSAFVAIGDHALDLGATRHHFSGTAAANGLLDGSASLNEFASLGRAAHTEVRDRAGQLLSDHSTSDDISAAVVRIDELTMLLPVHVGDFVDFYSSLHHATNLGRMFRPDGDALLPNWRHVPVGYHGRSGTIVADHSSIARPCGVRSHDSVPEDGPTEQLDIELEVGAVIGTPSEPGRRVTTARADDHLFGLCLVNDWSARDIQSFEYQPLGPFLAKSFATSMSPWIVTLDALAPFRVDPPLQEPPVVEHLRTSGPTGFDLHLEVLLQSQRMQVEGVEAITISSTSFADMYWTPAQQLAHMTSNGAHVRAGDLFASGTVSGPTPGTEGSLIELTRRGERPIDLPDGTIRTFLADGDTVTLRGWAGADPITRIGLGTVSGTITPTTTPETNAHHDQGAR